MIKKVHHIGIAVNTCGRAWPSLKDAQRVKAHITDAPCRGQRGAFPSSERHEINQPCMERPATAPCEVLKSARRRAPHCLEVKHRRRPERGWSEGFPLSTARGRPGWRRAGSRLHPVGRGVLVTCGAGEH
jgi:hypothetical protein